METLEEIIKFSIGGITITGIVVYFGKLILNKSSDIILENHKNRLEISKAEHQIKFSKLHAERGEIIKIIYKAFYELETKLEIMTTLFQGPEWRTDKTRDEDAISKYRETCELLENNRIFFSKELCDQLSSALEDYKAIINQMLQAKNHAKFETDGTGYRFPEGQGSIDLWRDAEQRTKNEIRTLRLELAKVFRDLIGA